MSTLLHRLMFENLPSFLAICLVDTNRDVAVDNYASPFTASAHVPYGGNSKQQVDARRVPPRPLGGVTNRYTIPVNCTLDRAVSLTETYASKHCQDFQQSDDKFTTVTYIHNDAREQICVTMQLYSVGNNELAVELQHQACDNFAFSAIFQDFSKYIASESAADASASASESKSSAPCPPIMTGPPELDFSVFGDDFNLEEELAKSLDDDIKQLMTLSDVNSGTVRAQAIRGLVDIALQSESSARAVVAAGGLRRMIQCISDAAVIPLDDYYVYFSPASPERDMCHNAVYGIAVLCEKNDEARATALELGALTAITSFAAVISTEYSVHLRELFRELLRVFTILVQGLSTESPVFAVFASTMSNVIHEVVRNVETHCSAVNNKTVEDERITIGLNVLRAF